MNLRESMGIALGGIRANKLRSFLTLLGIIIGVASVIAVVSFVEGLNRFVTQKLLNAGANVFVVDKYGFITSQEEFDQASKNPDVTLDDADALRAGVRHASLVVAQTGSIAPLHYRGKVMNAVAVNGRSAGYDLVDDITIDRGRHLSEFDDSERRAVVVIGPEVAEELFGTIDPVGRLMRIDRYDFEIVGVTKAKGKIFGQSQDRFVTVPVETFRKYWQERGSLSLAVKSVDQASLELAQQEARNILRARRHQRPGQKDRFGITTADTWLTLYRTLTGGIFVVSIGVAAISLFVGGIVIMNIMLVSVTERTREIGIRKALGARSRDIRRQFLVESSTLSVLGAMIGIAFGFGISGILKYVDFPTSVAPWSIFLSVAVGAGVGIIAGTYPAVRAARLDPIVALRSD